MGAAASSPKARVEDPPSPADAQRLCRRVSRGDRDAAETLARAVMPTARTIARRMTRRSSDAQDATQLAVLAVLRAAPSFRGDGSLRAWARTICVRTIGRWCARADQRRGSDPVQEDTLVAEDPFPALADRLPRALEDYLSRLSPAQRTALLLRHAYGCTVPEVAEITDSPIPTVKSRLKGALDKLRQAIRRDAHLGVRGPTGAA